MGLCLPEEVVLLHHADQGEHEAVAFIDGVEERVRLLGIDTPELPRQDRRGEFLAVEAAEVARDLALGQRVLLSGDPQRNDRDDYGRLLRYVRLSDGRLLNAELLRRGYAHVFARYPFGRQDEFLASLPTVRGCPPSSAVGT